MMKMMVEEGEKKKSNMGMGEEEEGMCLGSTVRTAEIVLRVVPMGLCLAALVVMLNNAQHNDYGSVSYANLGAFTYLVYANGICAAYSFFSALYTAVPAGPPGRMSRAWTVFFFDQVLTYVILAAGTVSAEVLYLAYNGDEGVTWSKECVVFGGFCRRALASVGITLAAVACYALLSLLSSYRLFTNYPTTLPPDHPPSPPTSITTVAPRPAARAT